MYPRIAAAAALAGVIATAIYFVAGRPQEPITWQTLHNPGGREMRITLPDQSIVQLNGGASLLYPSAFTGERVVKLLAGEAFFTVAGNPDQPFWVETAGAGRIQVLGTSFNVKPTRKSELEITLTSGKIRFKGGEREVVLKPGEQVLYALQQRTLSAVMPADTNLVLNWTNNIIQFKDTPIEEVLEELETRFGITFIVEKKPTAQTISGKFDNRSLAAILSLLEKTTDVKFRQTKTTIFVTR